MYYLLHARITFYINELPPTYIYYLLHTCITFLMHVLPSAYVHYSLNSCITFEMHRIPSTCMHYILYTCITFCIHALPSKSMYFLLHACTTFYIHAVWHSPSKSYLPRSHLSTAYLSINTDAYTRRCTHKYKHTYRCKHTFKHKCKYTPTYIYACTHKHEQTWMNTHKHRYILVHIRSTYTNIHKHTHIYTPCYSAPTFIYTPSIHKHFLYCRHIYCKTHTPSPSKSCLPRSRPSEATSSFLSDSSVWLALHRTGKLKGRGRGQIECRERKTRHVDCFIKVRSTAVIVIIVVIVPRLRIVT